MKKFYFLVAGALTIAVLIGIGHRAGATGNPRPESPLISTTIVISQVYGGGGATSGSPTYLSDYVELKNISSSPQSLNGLSIMYGSTTGQFGSVANNAFALPNATLQPGQYFLIAMTAGTVGGVLPVSADATGGLSMSGTGGKVALTSGLAANNCGGSSTPCPIPSSSIIDLVAYGGANNAEGGSAVSALSTTTMAVRKNSGCTDTDNNLNDFDVVTAANPRNTSSSPVTCNLGSSIQASMGLNPSAIVPGGDIVISISVIPATTPASSGITARANLSAIGGAATQPLYDDGTNGDTTAGDNVFSFTYNVPATQSGGNVTITGSASDTQSRTANTSSVLIINAAPADDDPLVFGNPSGATANVANENNYLMAKPQYTLSYNRGKATANWVAWRVAAYWLGSTSRTDSFRADTTLPSGWYQVSDSSYSGSGYDRGHMCPSGDRTNSVENNSATFLMTNMVPQLPANNQGPWAVFENDVRAIAGATNEVYVFSGPVGNIGTIDSGRVVVPQYTWKVVLILPEGNNDLSRVTRSTRVFGIIIPNSGTINSAWRTYRVTVDEVEALTGYDFFSLVPKGTQTIMERRRDIQ